MQYMLYNRDLLCVCVCVLQAALHRSRQLARDVRWSMLALLLGTLLVARLVEIVQAQVLLRLPPRIFVDIPEIPVLVTFLAYLGNRIVNR